MNIFKKLFRKRTEYQPLEEAQQEEAGGKYNGREMLDVTDERQRKKYVENCLEQMRESAAEIERLQDEYRLVNAYLKDMEEIDALPEYEKSLVEEHAKAIYTLDGDREQFESRSSHMAESDYRRMERMEEEAEEGIRKLKEAEEYQEKIKKDLQRLEGEKHACRYRMNEARVSLINTRGMTVICVIAAAACVVMLLCLELLLSMDAKIGYLIMAVVAALVMTALFVKYKEADRELHVASSSLNKVILLQNMVEIRLVNNTNLLDYLYVKYGTGSAERLKELWTKYQVEKEERQKIKRTEEDLDFFSGQLVKQLKNYQLFDPVIWVHQTKALIDPKEMVEIRHNMILRRQNLRKQIDYNTENAKSAKEEIMNLVKEYPRYGEEILDMVSVYEKRFGL